MGRVVAETEKRPLRALLLDLDGTLLADDWYADALVQTCR